MSTNEDVPTMLVGAHCLSGGLLNFKFNNNDTHQEVPVVLLEVEGDRLVTVDDEVRAFPGKEILAIQIEDARIVYNDLFEALLAAERSAR